MLTEKFDNNKIHSFWVWFYKHTFDSSSRSFASARLSTAIAKKTFRRVSYIVKKKILKKLPNYWILAFNTLQTSLFSVRYTEKKILTVFNGGFKKYISVKDFGWNNLQECISGKRNHSLTIVKWSNTVKRWSNLIKPE